MKTYTIEIQCGMVCKNFTLNAIDRVKAYSLAESIISERFVIVDVIELS